MNKRIMCIAAGLLSAVMLSTNAFAAELTLSAARVTPEGEITISGLGNPGSVYVEIVKDYQPGSLVGERKPVVIDLVQTDESGRFSQSYKMPQDAEMGDYSVILSDTTVTADKNLRVWSMFYASTDQVKTALDRVNEHMSSRSSLAADLADDAVVKPLQLSTQVENSIYLQYTNQVLQSVQAQCPTGGFLTAEALSSALSSAMGVAMLNNASQFNFDETILQYADELNLDLTRYTSDSTLRAAMIRCGASVLADYGLTLPEKAPDAFRAVDAVASVNLAARGKLIDTLTSYKDIFGLDTAGITQAKAAFLAEKLCVTGRDKEYMSVSAIKQAYQVALNSWTNNNNNGSHTGSGGGGSGTGGGGSSIGGGGNSYARSGIASGTIEVETNSIPMNTRLQPLFGDLESSAWAIEYIERLAVLHMVNGRAERVFEPESPVTREEFTKLLVLAAGLEPDEETPAFPDVVADGWYAPYVASAVKNGLVQGYPDGSFGIGQEITREEAVVLLSRTLSHGGYKMSDKSANLIFADQNEISEFAADAVALCVGAGVIQGDDAGCFAPKRQITRAETAKVICKLLDLLKEDVQ